MRTLTKTAAGVRVGRSGRQVERLIRAGKGTVVRVGHQVRIPLGELERLKGRLRQIHRVN